MKIIKNNRNRLYLKFKTENVREVRNLMRDICQKRGMSTRDSFNFLYAVSELLDNAFYHSSSTFVNVIVKHSNREIRIEIENNGLRYFCEELPQSPPEVFEEQIEAGVSPQTGLYLAKQFSDMCYFQDIEEANETKISIVKVLNKKSKFNEKKEEVKPGVFAKQ